MTNPNNTTSLKQILSFLWREARNFRPMMFGVLVLQIAQMACELLVTWLLKGIIDDITSKTLPAFLLITMTFGVVNHLSSLIFRWQNVTHNRVGRKLMQRIRDRLYVHITALPIAEVLKRPELIEDLTALFEMEAQISNLLMTYTSNSLRLMGNFLALALFLNPLWILVEIIFIGWAYVAYVLRARKKSGATQRKTDARVPMLTMVAEGTSFEGAAAIRLFQMQSQLREQYLPLNETFTEAGIEEQLTLLRMEQSSSIIFGYMRMAVYLIGGIQLIGQSLHIGSISWMPPAPSYVLSGLLAIASLLTSSAASLNLLFGTQQRLVGLVTPLKQLIDFLQLSIEEQGNIALDPQTIRGKVEVQGVTFAHKSFVLGPVSFTVEPGEMLAIVGPSGSGKSTLAHLLEQFFIPDEGVIKIDGRDIREFSAQTFYSIVSAVLQDSMTFAGTIKENLLLARKNASELELKKALETASLYDEVMSDPDGYNRKLGRGGHGLSGGQRQRLAIARAVLLNPRILILDEATSALDAWNNVLFQKALSQLRRETGMTVVVIAHNLPMIKFADKILVMQNGRIVEQGTHKELISIEGGVYAFMSHVFEEGSESESSE